MYHKVHSLGPIIHTSSKVLVLGTLPGAKSLALKQYYADPTNQFWRIIYGACGEASIDAEYKDRISFLLDHKIAIWDVLHAADRKGSSDANIKRGTPNNIPELLRNYPEIKRIILAGRRAERSFRTHFPNPAVETVEVPSSSQTPGWHTKTLDEKIQVWKAALTSEYASTTP